MPLADVKRLRRAALRRIEGEFHGETEVQLLRRPPSPIGCILEGLTTAAGVEGISDFGRVLAIRLKGDGEQPATLGDLRRGQVILIAGHHLRTWNKGDASQCAGLISDRDDVGRWHALPLKKFAQSLILNEGSRQHDGIYYVLRVFLYKYDGFRGGNGVTSVLRCPLEGRIRVERTRRTALDRIDLDGSHELPALQTLRDLRDILQVTIVHQRQPQVDLGELMNGPV